ncbi:two-component system response regulator [Paenibacillus agricola]|uniref:EAL domain-containing protein n=1 Tax=Paenibacillus agricola TaxID=2716264 RepID=A0ABX0JCZ8_9BACL|nr:EAL domain-containing protein [Paenibacillus agricola]NHN34037.1 EAL domain-containing protein [Paenibacillus agricola]
MNQDYMINVLLVDDRSENLLALEALLDYPYVHLTKCLSGEEALKCVMKEEYALILLDVQMPGLDGYETAKLIKSREKSKDIPIIFVTAINKEPEHVFSGYTAGAIDYVFKPFDPDVLKLKVEQLIKIFINARGMKQQTEALFEQTKALENANQELVRVTQELKKSEALHRLIGETSADTILIINTAHEIISINPTVESMFDYQISEVLGRGAELLIPLELLKAYGNTQVMSIEKCEITLFSKNNRSFRADIHLKTSLLDGNYIFVCTIRDISVRFNQMLELEHMATHDHLTQLPNRKKLYEMINSLVLDERKGFTLLLMDLDHFKAINDTLGHQFGDLLLLKIGNLITQWLSNAETIFRLGGDEFAVLIPNCTPTQGLSTAQIILANIDQPVSVEEVNLSIGASMGIVSFPEHGKDIQTLLRRADVAMYSAKRLKSGYSIYSEEQDEKDPYRLLLMGDLRAAIEKNELYLVYQPKAELKTNTILSAEALLRWKHPKLGLIPPSDFIPIAEQIGVINAITTWVLNEALKQSKLWEAEHIDIEIAVNLSARNLQDAELPIRLKALLQQYGVSPRKITLEITESFIMADPVRAKEVLMNIHEMGIQLSIDDFGTGYSSLAYLKTLPVDTIKIDKSFVADMANDATDSMIVRSIIFLAHNLGLKVVAEGVEDLQSWNMLASYGCDIIQGYYLQKPLAPYEFKRWLVARMESGITSGQL